MFRWKLYLYTSDRIKPGNVSWNVLFPVLFRALSKKSIREFSDTYGVAPRLIAPSIFHSGYKRRRPYGDGRSQTKMHSFLETEYESAFLQWGQVQLPFKGKAHVRDDVEHVVHWFSKPYTFECLSFFINRLCTLASFVIDCFFCCR